jgi:pilus assembly protein CpaB
LALRFLLLKRTWPYLLAVGVGLGVAAFSFRAIKGEASSQAGVKLPVAARDLPPYTLVQAQDLSWSTFPSELPGAIENPAEAVGKVLSRGVPKDYPLRVSDLKDPGSLDVQLVSVNVDSSRLGGARPGDLVDVYWIQPAEKTAWAPGTGATLVAQDARVVSVLDKNGQPVDTGQGLVAAAVQGTAARAPAIAVLAVKAGEVKSIIPGAAQNNTCIALVRKFKEGGGQVGAVAGGQGNSPPEAPAGPAGPGK